MHVQFVKYFMIFIFCISVAGCAELVQTKRMVNGKETILWTNKSNLDRLEQQDVQRKQKIDYYQSLPRRPIGEIISILLNNVTVDPQLKESFREDDFMSRLVEKFEQNRIYEINQEGYDADLEIDTHVELSKEIGIFNAGKPGEYWAITIMGTVRNRYYPDQPYEVQVSSDILHNIEAINDYYKKIDRFIKNQVAPNLPDLEKE